MKNKLIFCVLTALLTFLAISSHSQDLTYLSQVWVGQGGEMAQFAPAKVATDHQRNVYSSSSTFNSSNNHDILIQKFDRNGNLVWEETYNGSANLNDYSAGIFVDDSLNVYVTGTSIEDENNGYDLICLKYNSSGQLIWTYTYNNSGFPDPYDAGTSITGDNAGHIFVTGSSFGSSTMTDYVTLKINSITGSSDWISRYDYNYLNEVPSNIILKSGKVYITGASQQSSNPNKWNMATVVYDEFNGNQISVKRTSGSATSGTDEIFDIDFDSSGNIFLVGSVKNSGSDKDLAVYKLDENLNLLWSDFYDGDSMSDEGYSIDLDSQGNIVVCGYETIGTDQNLIALKYDNSGTLLWQKTIKGNYGSVNKGYGVAINSEDQIFITGAMSYQSKDIVTYLLDLDGTVIRKVTYDGNNNLDDRPLDITIDSEGDVLIVAQEELPNSTIKNISLKYTLTKRELDYDSNQNGPQRVKSELIVRFLPSSLNISRIDDTNFPAGKLSEFITSPAIDTISDQLGYDVSDLLSYKIHSKMTSNHTSSISRSGNLVPMHNHWATLVVSFPKGKDIDVIADSLNALKQVISFAHENSAVVTLDQPNDQFYTGNQTGLFSLIHGINVENAWGATSTLVVGEDFTKVGILDTGVNFRHEDFGDGTWDGSKVSDGWDYFNDQFPFEQDNPDGDGHGTAIAGILGALRNNNDGIAGIAGGDGSLNDGCQLISLKVAQENSGNPASGPVSFLIGAMVEGAFEATGSFGYGLDILNVSLSINSDNIDQDQILALEQATIDCTRLGCTVIAAAGNDGLEVPRLPASYSDELVIKVGGSDISGSKWMDSNLGHQIDVIAPSTPDMYRTLDHDNNSGYSSSLSGTSLAVPHVVGVAALLAGEHHPNNGYPNRLDPEDLEKLIEKYATDVGINGYDDLNGHGRVNAFGAVLNSSLPSNYILHVGGTGNQSVSDFPSLPLLLDREVNGIQPGFYLAQRREISQTFQVTLQQNEIIEEHWPRFNSSSGLTQELNQTSGLTDFDYTLNQSGNQVTINTTTNAWFIVSDSDGNVQFNSWIPLSDPDDIHTEISLQIGQTLDSDDHLKEDYQVVVFPNPSQDNFILSFLTSYSGNVTMRLFDNIGRELSNHNHKIIHQQPSEYQLDLSNYPSGLYFCHININGETTVKKLIKK